MQKVLTAAQMREVDRLTTERYGIPSILLMENAAHAVARVITEKLGGSVKGKSILILCGPGNNGGDGAALGRILALANATVQVVIFGKVADTKGDASANFGAARSVVDFFDEIESREKWDSWLARSAQDWDIVVDAIFGTGLSRPIDIWLSHIIRHVNILNGVNHELRRTAISVDIPSGLNSDSAEVISEVFQADLTIAFTAPKVGNVIAPASSFNGQTIVANIGSPFGLLYESEAQLFLADFDDARNWLIDSDFAHDSYKNKRGHALIIAGSESYSGAAVLAADAAMRSGVGLVTVATARSSKDSIAARVLPEVMVRGVAETADGAIAEEAFDEISDILEKVNAVAIGSGLSQSESTKIFVEKVIDGRKTPIVVDADALNLLSPWVTDVAASVDAGESPGDQSYPLILTPHEGEFLRLLGTEDKSLIKDRVTAVREFSQKHSVILVLKGERVLIGEPGGKVVVNPTGNSGLGKAGNGDTLTGILAGFVTQAVVMKIDIFETVVAAVYVAGMAGDVAEKRFGKRVMTASDVRECLVDVFEELSK